MLIATDMQKVLLPTPGKPISKMSAKSGSCAGCWTTAANLSSRQGLLATDLIPERIGREVKLASESLSTVEKGTNLSIWDLRVGASENPQRLQNILNHKNPLFFYAQNLGKPGLWTSFAFDHGPNKSRISRCLSYLLLKANRKPWLLSTLGVEIHAFSPSTGGQQGPPYCPLKANRTENILLFFVAPRKAQKYNKKRGVNILFPQLKTLPIS